MEESKVEELKIGNKMSSEPGTEDTAKPCTFFKKTGRRRGERARKREQHSSSSGIKHHIQNFRFFYSFSPLSATEESDEESAVVRRQKKVAKGALYQTVSVQAKKLLSTIKLSTLFNLPMSV